MIQLLPHDQVKYVEEYQEAYYFQKMISNWNPNIIGLLQQVQSFRVD